MAPCGNSGHGLWLLHRLSLLGPHSNHSDWLSKWMNLRPGQPMPCEGKNWVVSPRCWQDIDLHSVYNCENMYVIVCDSWIAWGWEAHFHLDGWISMDFYFFSFDKVQTTQNIIFLSVFLCVIKNAYLPNCKPKRNQTKLWQGKLEWP